MEEEKVTNESTVSSKREQIYSKSVRAGKRTYFIDVKSTRQNDLFMTITESKKRFNKDGRYFYEKHKIFLYKEDFTAFSEALQDVMSFIQSKQPVEEMQDEMVQEPATEPSDEYTNVEFEDLEVPAAVAEEQE